MYGIEGLLAGRTLVDRYRVDAVMARGGMGAVYRAHDLRLGREVAVKVITVAAGDAAAHQRLRARFLREARAAAALHHPNVVQVFDYGADPDLGLDFLVMELLRGEDLATRLGRKGAPAVPTALAVLYQAARGLAAGHRAGLVHRDVKPGNLFLEPGDRIGEVQVKVLDFGIADIVAAGDGTITQLTVAGRSPYSPAYASPEQLRGEERLTPATDVFSLGAVGFHLLTGRRAFRSTDPAGMVVELSSAVATELPRVRGLLPAARQVVQRALAPDPRARYPDATVLAAALEPLVAHAGGGEPRVEEPTLLAEPGTRVFGGPVTAPPRRGRPDYAGPPEPHPLPAPRPPGRLRRAARAAWELGVTAAAVLLFAGAWFLVTTGLEADQIERVYLGAAASVVGTPWAIHRLLRRPGSYRFALLSCVAGTAAAALLLRDREMETVLAVVFLVQVALSLLAERLTRPRAADLPG